MPVLFYNSIGCVEVVNLLEGVVATRVIIDSLPRVTIIEIRGGLCTASYHLQITRGWCKVIYE